MAEDVEIRVRDNGPYLIDAPVRVVDAEGNTIETSGGTIALCRCGHSEAKPFCDGSHKRADFESRPRG